MNVLNEKGYNIPTDSFIPMNPFESDNLSSMSFVLLCSFDNYIPAHIALGKLKDEFINCYLQDEYTVTIDPLLSNAIGGIKLMVAEAQIERAKEILKNYDSPD